MKLAVPAAERAWACTTAQPAVSPAPYYEAPLLIDLFNEPNPRYGFAGLYLPSSSSAGMEEHCIK